MMLAFIVGTIMQLSVLSDLLSTTNNNNRMIIVTNCFPYVELMRATHKYGSTPKPKAFFAYFDIYYSFPFLWGNAVKAANYLQKQGKIV